MRFNISSARLGLLRLGLHRLPDECVDGTDLDAPSLFLLNSLREELHLYAQKKGDMVGELVLEDRDGGGAQISLVLTPEGPDEGHYAQPDKT